MKILYGVQATGNGHISRSREVVKALKALGHHVQVLISGRAPHQLPTLPEFGDYITRRGFTFIIGRGKIQPLRTARQLQLMRFYTDILDFDAAGYDLALTDFEPLTARIARRAKVPCIGIGHQYAFNYDIPMAGANIMTLWLIRHFAFCDQSIGLHWHHFGFPLLPPIVPTLHSGNGAPDEKSILIYLPFESVEAIRHLLQPLNGHTFRIYGKTTDVKTEGHLQFRPFSRHGFLDDLHRCNGVICNAGFELPSEALQLGKKLLVRPLAGQMEQLSNSLAVERLGLGASMTELDPGKVRHWLDQPPGRPQNYPDVAILIAKWIDQGLQEGLKSLSRRAWEQVLLSES